MEDLGTVAYQRQMPRDMTVERPHSRIVGVILYHNVTVGSKQLHVSPLRIRRVGDRDSIPEAFTLVENEHIVAVKMHRLFV